MKILDLSPDLSVKAHGIQAIKRGASDGQCVVFLKGQSAMDGFVVERDFDEAVEEWGKALEEED